MNTIYNNIYQATHLATYKSSDNKTRNPISNFVINPEWDINMISIQDSVNRIINYNNDMDKSYINTTIFINSIDSIASNSLNNSTDFNFTKFMLNNNIRISFIHNTLYNILIDVTEN